MGIGIKKAFNGNGGIKLEFGFRFTNTDYLDDVSGNYYDWAANGGNETQITMSGTKSGHEWTYIGYGWMETILLMMVSKTRFRRQINPYKINLHYTY